MSLTEDEIKRISRVFDANLVMRLNLVNLKLRDIQAVSSLGQLFYINLTNNELTNIDVLFTLPVIRVIIADSNKVR